MHKEYEEILKKIAKQERKVRHTYKKLITYKECVNIASHPGEASEDVLKLLENKYEELCESISLADATRLAFSSFSPSLVGVRGFDFDAFIKADMERRRKLKNK